MSNFVIGDEVVVVESDGDVEAGMTGRVAFVDRDQVLVDFGDGFDGHNGIDRLETDTGWWLHQECIEMAPRKGGGFVLVALRDGGPETLPERSYADGKEAAAAARELSRELGVKVQPRRVSAVNADRWRDREAQRFQDGTYTAMPKAWDLEPIPDHFLHMSRHRDGMVAFTPDHESGLIDRKVRMRPGRYLERFYPLLPQDQRNHYAAIAAARGELKFAETAEEMKRAYTHGPRSCMSYPFDFLPCHPAEIYAAGDLAVAYVEDEGGAIIARCVVWPEKKRHTRPYGREGTSGFDQILALLKAHGYKEEDLAGARLRKVERTTKGRMNYVCPYLDAAGSRQGQPAAMFVAIEEDCLRILPGPAHVSYRANNHEEALLIQYREDDEEEDMLYCERCGEYYDRDDMVSIYSGRDGMAVEQWCRGCAQDDAHHDVGVYRHRGRYYLRDAEPVELFDGSLAPPYLVGNYYVLCRATRKYYPATIAVALSGGDWVNVDAWFERGFTCPVRGVRLLIEDGWSYDGVVLSFHPDAGARFDPRSFA